MKPSGVSVKSLERRCTHGHKDLKKRLDTKKNGCRIDIFIIKRMVQLLCWVNWIGYNDEFLWRFLVQYNYH